MRVCHFIVFIDFVLFFLFEIHSFVPRVLFLWLFLSCCVCVFVLIDCRLRDGLHHLCGRMCFVHCILAGVNIFSFRFCFCSVLLFLLFCSFSCLCYSFGTGKDFIEIQISNCPLFWLHISLCCARSIERRILWQAC